MTEKKDQAARPQNTTPAQKDVKGQVPTTSEKKHPQQAPKPPKKN